MQTSQRQYYRHHKDNTTDITIIQTDCACDGTDDKDEVLLRQVNIMWHNDLPTYRLNTHRTTKHTQILTHTHRPNTHTHTHTPTHRTHTTKDPHTHTNTHTHTSTNTPTHVYSFSGHSINRTIPAPQPPTTTHPHPITLPHT
eukprot:GHVQ01030847.1.p1 GENE.GHVQ01030847.1~~GHVQ01030847.1.p1  ORF type:complete len:142 (-),score=40.27 GHVQ01030847.1:589-1014(-)